MELETQRLITILGVMYVVFFSIGIFVGYNLRRWIEEEGRNLNEKGTN